MAFTTDERPARTRKWCRHILSTSHSSKPSFPYNPAMDIFEKPPRRDIQVNFQVTAQEKARLDAAAKKANMSIAEYIRTAVNETARRDTPRKKKKKKS